MSNDLIEELYFRTESLKKQEEALKNEVGQLKRENNSLKIKVSDMSKETEGQKLQLQKMEQEFRKEEEVGNDLLFNL